MKKLLILGLICFFGCSQTPVTLYKTMKGQYLSQTQMDSLLTGEYIVHFLDTTYTADSVVYSIYHYHESAQYADLKKRHTGRSLQAFSLQDMDGNTINYASLAGKPVMVNCWSVVCKPCILEMPILNKLKAMYGDQVVFLAIAKEDAAAVQRLLSKHPFAFTQLPGGEEYMAEIGVRTFPTSFFISPSGEILEVTEGTPVAVDEAHPEDTTWKAELLHEYETLIHKSML